MRNKIALFTVMILSLSLIVVAGCGPGPNGPRPQAGGQQQSSSAGGGQDAAPTAGGGGQDAAPTAGGGQTATQPSSAPSSSSNSVVNVDTNQGGCYSNSQEIQCPSEGAAFYGQDAQYNSAGPSYTNNNDGTITDNNTGLMWQQDAGDKMSYAEAVSGASSFNLAGYTDWRLPTVKELYSLIDFTGEDVSRLNSSSGLTNLVPYIDTDYFAFEYGDISGGRVIDSQWTTSTIYNSTVMNGQECFFGVNFADGRIKCYETVQRGGGSGGYFTIYVRGDVYGNNAWTDNGDGTLSDPSSGLMWTQADSGTGILWEDALSYCESMSLAGHGDWWLPNAKELQYIVDYSRSPDATNSPAIDPLFSLTSITNEGGQADYGHYWTSTTHLKYEGGFDHAVYVVLGRGLGYMNGSFLDVHGAGSQRTDTKTGTPSYGNSPQGDVVRIYNYVLCTRDE